MIQTCDGLEEREREERERGKRERGKRERKKKRKKTAKKVVYEDIFTLFSKIMFRRNFMD